jgi:hypothetical protein
MPVNGRRKGAKWELEVAKRIGTWWGGTFRRTPGSGGWTRGGKDGEGQLKGDLVQMDGPDFPFCVECKADEAWSLDKFLSAPDNSKLTYHLRQAWNGAAVEGKLPMLIAKRNRKEPVVLIPADSGRNCPCRMLLAFNDNNGNTQHVAVLLLEDLIALAPKVFMEKKAHAKKQNKP